MPPVGIRVRGLREFQRGIRAADRHLANDLRDTLEEAAQPVRAEAQRLAESRVRNLSAGDPWSRMRVGIRGSVAYVAPVERGVKVRGRNRLRRPKFKGLVLDRALEPALVNKRGEVEKRLEHLLDEVLTVWERTP